MERREHVDTSREAPYDMKGVVAYAEEPVVSSDFVMHPASCIFDASASGGGVSSLFARYF